MTDARNTPAHCPVDIPFADVQGGILTGYGRQGFPFARYGLVNVQDAAAGRAFVEELRNQVTTAVRWPSRRKALAPGRLPCPACGAWASPARAAKPSVSASSIRL